MWLYYREEDGKLKDLAMTKRERDALEACSRGKGAFIDVDRFWRRTIRWLEVRGFIEVRLDRDPLGPYHARRRSEMAADKRTVRVNLRACPDNCQAIPVRSGRV